MKWTKHTGCKFKEILEKNINISENSGNNKKII